MDNFKRGLIITRAKGVALVINLLSLIVSMVIMVFYRIDDLKLYSIYGTVVTIISLLSYIQLTRSMFSNFLIYFLSFCAFQFGQFYLYAFGVEYNYVFKQSFYSSFCSQSELLTVVKFTIVAIQLTMLAGVITTKETRNITEVTFFSQDIKWLKTAKIMYWISMPAAILIAVVEVGIALRYGYAGIRQGETAILLQRLDVFNKLSVFYVPSLIMIWINYMEEPARQRIVMIQLLTYSGMYLFVGQRTVGLALLAIIQILRINSGQNRSSRNNILIIIVLIAALMIVSNYVAEARRGNASFSADLITSTFSNFFGELGFSAFPFMVIAGACPNPIPFSKGLAYAASVLNFFPTFIDPTGFLRKATEISGEAWLTKYARTNFGIGYSLVSEAYYNFAWFGLIAIFVLGLLIGSFLNIKNRASSLFSYYIRIALTYALFTLPRRGSCYFFNSLFYYVFVFWIIHFFICSYLKKSGAPKHYLPK